MAAASRVDYTPRESQTEVDHLDLGGKDRWGAVNSGLPSV